MRSIRETEWRHFCARCNVWSKSRARRGGNWWCHSCGVKYGPETMVRVPKDYVQPRPLKYDSMMFSFRNQRKKFPVMPVRRTIPKERG